MTDDPKRYLDPLTLAKVRNLELQARLIVEGYLSGMHKSPYHGFSVEFAQHREYVPGDDLKHIDWKVYSRTGRFYLKQYEEETNLICWLLVDVSDSMNYSSGTADGSEQTNVTKYDYAAMSAVALTYLVLQQQDSVGLATFDDQVRDFVRPSSQPSHLKRIVKILNDRAGEREKTDLSAIFHDLAERLTRRSIIIILSDLFDETENILAGIKHLRHKRHEVVVLQILDRAELEFPFQDATLFRGLERFPELLTDPRSLRDGYLREFEDFLEEVSVGCRHQNADYRRLLTDEALDVVLSSYLSLRLARKK